ncbi:MAG: hypothetical protein ACYTF1_16265 [Planctomycetota bacterium]|jgi:hypothetical protein
MRTTEIFVEQVLIGLMVLITGALPFVERYQGNGKSLTIDILEGTGIIAVAYLLGIIFDRFADTLLSRYEQYHRLKFVLDDKEELKKKKNKRDDPYPEDYLCAKIRGKGNGASEWMEYLRSRIRLSRSLAVFAPALTLSALLTIGQTYVNDESGMCLRIFGAMALIYAYGFLFVQLYNNKIYKLPKTYEENIKYHVDTFSHNWPWEPTTIAAFLLALAAVILVTFIAIKEDSSLWATVPILLIGAGISVLSTWSWWRITGTYMKFLLACKRAEVV